jgi:hypothetical protein
MNLGIMRINHIFFKGIILWVFIKQKEISEMALISLFVKALKVTQKNLAISPIIVCIRMGKPKDYLHWTLWRHSKCKKIPVSQFFIESNKPSIMALDCFFC